MTFFDPETKYLLEYHISAKSPCRRIVRRSGGLLWAGSRLCRCELILVCRGRAGRRVRILVLLPFRLVLLCRSDIWSGMRGRRRRRCVRQNEDRFGGNVAWRKCQKKLNKCHENSRQQLNFPVFGSKTPISGNFHYYHTLSFRLIFNFISVVFPPDSQFSCTSDKSPYQNLSPFPRHNAYCRAACHPASTWNLAHEHTILRHTYSAFKHFGPTTSIWSFWGF